MIKLLGEPQRSGVIPGIRFNSYEDGECIAKEAGVVYNPLADQIIASVDKDGALKGGVLYNNWTGYRGSITMHTAGFLPGWINRSMLWVCFDYPFNQLEVKIIFGQVPFNNDKALKLNLHLGFKQLYVIPDVYPDEAMIVVGMRKDECRFLELGE